MNKKPKIKLDRISQENIDKFERMFCEAHNLNHSSEIYPVFKLTNLETSLQITNDFFRGKYVNLVNKVNVETQERFSRSLMHFNRHLEDKIESPLKVVLKKNVNVAKIKPIKTKKEDKENVNVNLKKAKIGAPNLKQFSNEEDTLPFGEYNEIQILQL